MRIVIVGGNGMLGHEMASHLSRRHDVTATLRRQPDPRTAAALQGCELISGIDVRERETWQDHVFETHPEVVVNCAGIVKQRVTDPSDLIAVNALFPHQLATCCARSGARLIHLSTDCVFSGRQGNYSEADEPDPVDAYGRTKLLGELEGPGSLTLRTSMIGLELGGHSGLVEWFLAQRGTVNGYRRAIWSGFTTIELARIIGHLIDQRPDLTGVWHVSSAPINKYDLLTMLNSQLAGKTRVVPDDSVVIDRSLNSARFQEATAYEPPSHKTMLAELAGAITNREQNRVA